MTDHQISPESIKMIEEEAWEKFQTELKKPKGGWPEAFYAAIEHAFEHALEEGIVVPGWQLDPGVEGSVAFHAANAGAELRDIRRSTEIGRMHDDLAQELKIERMASALAIAEGFNPNDIPVDTWERAKSAYGRKAQTIIHALEGMNA